MTQELLDAPDVAGRAEPVVQPKANPIVSPTESTAPLKSAALITEATLAAAALAACGGGGGGGSTTGGTSGGTGGGTSGGTGIKLGTVGYNFLTPVTDDDAARFLLQAQFSASDADIAAVRSSGFAPWLEAQLVRPNGPTGWDWLEAQGYGDVLSTNNYYDNSYPADYMIWNQLMTSPDTLRKRATLALSEYFVVSLTGLDFAWRSHAMAAYWDTLAANAFGNYRDLLEAVTLNVAMGYYLNTKGNKKEDSSGRQPDENYSREVMQLFTIGLVQLNLDGTAKLDAAGKKIDSYTASDVSNLARVFTGFDVDQSQNVTTVIPQTGGGTRTVGNTAFARLRMVQTAANHSNLAATFLGTTVAANTAGAAALKTALDTLFNHPNAAPFFCKQMIQRLVTSNPSPAYVQRVATVFSNNGAGLRGDLARVFAAILQDDEARGPTGLTAPEFGKLREPILRFVQWGRSFGVASGSGAWKIGDLSNAGTQLGQSPLRSPSVFNFFRPGYVPPSTALSAGAVAPEFQLVTESSVGGYLNYMMGVISNGLNSNDISAAYTGELAVVDDPVALVRRVSLMLCAGQLSAANQTLIATALAATRVDTGGSANGNLTLRKNRVYAAVLMVMASAEYLIQK